MDGHLALPLACAYLVGAFPTSIVVCRLLKGIDIRTVGSGNAGATNVLRILGWKVALFVLTVDTLKGVAGVMFPAWLFPGAGLWQRIAGGLLAIVGHVWTLFAGFKGGKGVGTALGVFLALLPLPAFLALVSWIGVVAKTRIVSAASLCAAAVLALSTLALAMAGSLAGGTPLAWFACGVAALVFFTHRANIRRLLQGTESKIQFSSGAREP